MRLKSRINDFRRDEETTEVPILRATSNGRFLDDPPEPAPGAPGFRKASTGRFVGNEFEDPGIERRGDNGQFTTTSDPQRINQDEAIDRFGQDNGDGAGFSIRDRGSAEFSFTSSEDERGRDLFEIGADLAGDGLSGGRSPAELTDMPQSTGFETEESRRERSKDAIETFLGDPL